MIGRALRRLHRGEQGITITELMIAVSVFTVVAAAFTGVVVSLQGTMGRQQVRSETNDQARLAIDRLDREVRSGNVLYDPAAESLPNYSLRVYTQANAPTSTPAFRCVQWALTDKRMIRRSWPPGQPELATGWSTVAEHIVNRDLPTPEPAFELDLEASKAGRTVRVLLAVNGNLAGQPTATIRIQTSLTGRNTSLGYPTEVCQTLPSEPIPS